jgi:hypothetical protein
MAESVTSIAADYPAGDACISGFQDFGISGFQDFVGNRSGTLPRVRVIVVAGAIVGLAFAAPAAAQAMRPLPTFVLDVRGLTVGFGDDEITRRDLGLGTGELPARGWGGVAAANLYLIRLPALTIGAAAEGVLARGTRTNTDLDGTVTSTVTRRLDGISGTVTLNFGHRDGFSYLAVGMGPMLFDARRELMEGPTAAREMTLNFGGGARWFNSPHFAFGFDVRLYETKPENPTVTSPGRERRRLLVLSAGVSIR